MRILDGQKRDGPLWAVHIKKKKKKKKKDQTTVDQLIAAVKIWIMQFSYATRPVSNSFQDCWRQTED